MKKVIFTVLSILLIICLSGCEKLEYKETQVQATVVSKRHRSGYFTKAGKTNIYHSARNYVKLEYDNYTEEINNKSLYDSVSEGDIITVIYGEGCNEDGILKRQYLKLIE